jgi:hypothetical protein
LQKEIFNAFCVHLGFLYDKAKSKKLGE